MIEIKNIHKSFDGNSIIKGISTSFEKGKTNLIIGQSGSGKTVLLKCLLGLHNPDSGEIIYDGVSNLEMTESEKTLLRRQMGMVFQGSALFDSMSVIENVMFPLDMLTDYNEEEIRPAFTNEVSSEKLNDFYKNLSTENTNFEQQNDIITYRVQIAASNKLLELKPYNFKGLKSLNVIKQGDLYKYFYDLHLQLNKLSSH